MTILQVQWTTRFSSNWISRIRNGFITTTLENTNETCAASYSLSSDKDNVFVNEKQLRNTGLITNKIAIDEDN